MPAMIVATPRATTITTTTIATVIVTIFKIQSHQIHHQTHLKINHPINRTRESKKETTLNVGDSMIAGLREVKLLRNRKVKVYFLPGPKEIYLHKFKSCNIYLKPEGFRKSKFTLSKVKSE